MMPIVRQVRGWWRFRRVSCPAVRPLILFNPISGSGKAKAEAERLLPVLEARGLEPTCLPTRPEDPRGWLPDALSGHDAVVVIGGDGAVHMTAPFASELQIPLFHQPAGTENLFSRDIRGTHHRRTPEEVASDLLANQVRRLDLAEVRTIDADGNLGETECMVIMASIGIDANIVRDVASRRTRGISRMTYFKPTVRNALTWSAPQVTARVDGEEVFADEPGMIIIANSRQYAARLDPARRAEMDDGSLDLVLLPARGSLSLTRWAMACWMGGRHLNSRRCRYHTGQSIEIRLNRPCPWQVDGDPPAHPGLVSGLQIDLRPGKLPVIA